LDFYLFGADAMNIFRPAMLVLGLTCEFMVAGASSAADVGPQLGLPANVTASMQGIDAHRIAEHTRFLANDLLEGRGTGTRGGDIAANYIASQFALYGLKPAGDNGGYLQKVEFVGVKTLAGTSAALQPAKGTTMDLKLAEDYVAGNQTQTDSVDIDAPIVFVGYGIEAPEYMTSKGWMSRARWCSSSSTNPRRRIRNSSMPKR
jgi:hypothetical protein